MISEEKLLQFIKKIIFIISQVFYKLVLEMTSAVENSWIILFVQAGTCSMMPQCSNQLKSIL